MNKEKKETLILNAMESLLVDGKGLSCTVSEIARTAGIGKGSIYYYFESKEEIAKALILRIYSDFIENCKSILDIKLNALEKLKLLFKTYYNQSANSAIDTYLHLPQNADMHQKSLAQIVIKMSPIVSKILEQGVNENIFQCTAPNEYAQIIVTVLAFLFDYGIFKQIPEDTYSKMKAFANILEKSLNVEKGQFSFLYNR